MIRRTIFLTIIIAFGVFSGCRNQKNITNDISQSNDMSQSLRMEKQQSLLTGQQWLLVELNGKAVPGEKNLNSQPIFEIRLSDNRIIGNGSCNQFFGSFEMKEDNHLTISDLGATKMACPEMETEKSFFEALGKVDIFVIEGDQLLLQQGDGLLLARFIAVIN